MRIVLASINPVKLSALESVARQVFPDATCIPLSLPSGVSNQPIGEETMIGAINRAKAAFRYGDIGVGIEGGISKVYNAYYSFGAVAIYDGEILASSTSGWYELPSWVMNEINEGKELGDVVDEIKGEKNIKQREGAVYHFTNGIMDRKALYEHGLRLAFGSYLYKKGKV